MKGDIHMIVGNSLWDDQIIDGMMQMEIIGKAISTYRNIPMNLYNVLLNSSKTFENKIAIIDNWGRKYSYSQLINQVDQFASYLVHTKGIQKGDHIGLIMYNCIEFCVSFLAACKIGAVSVPIPSKYKKDEIHSLIDKSDLQLIVCDETLYSYVVGYENQGVSIIQCIDEQKQYGFSHLEKAHLPEVPSVGVLEDDVIIMFTSGTTSMSKGVCIKNYNMLHAIISYQRILKLTEEDKSIIPVPIYHITGLVALLGLFIYIGGTLYLHRHFDAKRVLTCAKQEKLTFIHASPTVFIMLLEEKQNFPQIDSLKKFACGSSNMPVKKLEEIGKWLPQVDFYTVYGLTETTSPATIFPENAIKSMYIGSSGKPIPGTEFKVIDEKDKELPANMVGEILVRGSVVLEHYYHKQTDAITEDGWLKTGDLGYFNEANYLYIVDRKKDMINHGGEKIWSFDIENMIYQIEGVEEVAVVGIPNEKYGEVAAAVIKYAPYVSYTEEDIQNKLKEKLPKFKIPKKIIFVTEVLKTPNGKIDKKNIRKMLIDQ